MLWFEYVTPFVGSCVRGLCSYLMVLVFFLPNCPTCWFHVIHHVPSLPSPSLSRLFNLVTQLHSYHSHTTHTHTHLNLNLNFTYEKNIGHLCSASGSFHFNRIISSSVCFLVNVMISWFFVAEKFNFIYVPHFLSSFFSWRIIMLA